MSLQTLSDTLNKLIVNGEIKFDLTEDTVTESDVLSGINFHLPSGAAAIGTMGGTGDVKTATYTPSSNSSTATFSVTKEPIMFACIATSQLSQTATYYINTVCSDGTSTHRVTCYRSSVTTSSSTTYTGLIYCGDSANITWSYTDGTLTIRSLSTSGGGGYFASGITYTLFYI